MENKEESIGVTEMRRLGNKRFYLVISINQLRNWINKIENETESKEGKRQVKEGIRNGVFYFREVKRFPRQLDYIEEAQN